MKKNYFLLLLSMICCLSAWAQTGISYQAALRDANGEALANSTVSVRFFLRQGSASGSLLYAEHQLQATDDFGLLNLSIGQGTLIVSSPAFSSVNWSLQPIFLVVECDANLDGTFEQLSSGPLLPVPIAFYALDAPGNDYSAGAGIGISGNTISNTGDPDPDDDVTNSSVADGDLAGTFFNLQINANTIGSEEVVNGSLLGIDLAQLGAVSGQVLEWNGSFWAPADDNSGGSYAAGTGIGINGNTISNTGDTDPGDDVTSSSAANGDLSGTFFNLQINANTVGSMEIANGSVSGSDLAQAGAVSGQVLEWNGTMWAPADDNSGGSYAAGAGIGINGNIIANTGDINPADDLTTATNFGGDLSGTASNLQLVPNTVGSVEIADAAVGSTELGQMGAGNGQVLKWDGSAWTPGTDLQGSGGGNYAAGAGISINAGNVIANTGDINPADDLTTATNFGGDLSGTASNLQLVPDAVGSAEIANGSVSGSDLAQAGAVPGQVLEWNGTAWAPADDNSGGSYTAGTGIGINGNIIANTGDINPADDLTTTTNFGGDLSGTASNLQLVPNTVGSAEIADAAVGSTELGQMGAGNGQVLKWDGSAWVPGTDLQGSGGGNYTAGAGISINTGNIIANTGDTDPADDLTNTSNAGGDLSGTFSNLQIAGSAVGTAELAADAVTSAKILNGTIAAADLAAMGATGGQVLQWNGTAWAPATAIAGNMQDADGDTKIQVEESPDEDIIRFDLGGTENMVLRKNASGTFRLELFDMMGNTFVGQNAGRVNTTGYANTAHGGYALYSNTDGYDNTANGLSALYSNTTGHGNTANGGNALYSNNDGYDNTANGSYALYYNSTGSNNTATGAGTLNNNTTGYGNTAHGGYALYSNNDGYDNTANGFQSLYYNASGFYNTANGMNALLSNTSGFGNTATGRQALYANNDGNNNTANGMNALFSNNQGYENTANGVNALYSNTSGAGNTANGVNALFSNSVGGANTANGYCALYANTGNFNTANGHNALYANTIGSGNTANGFQSLYSNNTGGGNTATGVNALRANSSGINNTATGLHSLASNTTGFSNTAVGRSSLFSNTVRSNLVAVGDSALFNNGLNASSPFQASSNTAVGSKALFSNTIGSNNTANGLNALFSNIDGINNTADGVNALFSNTTGNSNTANGVSALFPNTTGSNNTAHGVDAFFTLSALNNTTCTGFFSGGISNVSNRIEIGNSSVSFIGGQVGWSTYSDARIKTQVQENVPGLDFITRLRPVTYHLDIHKQNAMCFRGKKEESDWKEKYDIEKKQMTGFIAQEVEQAAKAAGYDFSGVEKAADEVGMYSVRYSEFVVPLVKAVQEQQTEIGNLKMEIQAQQTEIERLKKVEAQLDKITAALQGAGIAVEK